MGVYIKGMEMPREGHVIVRIYANGKVCEPTECAGVWSKVATAVPVPAHGRLIDADALIESNKYLRYNPAECEEGSYDEGWAVGFNAGARHATEHAVYAHTIIEAEGKE